MIREVQDGIVDASIAGFSATQERFEVVDFSQGLFPYLQTLIIKRPLKTDFSVRYFWLGKNHCLWAFLLSNHIPFKTEYTKTSWLMVLIAQVILLLILTIFIYTLIKALQVYFCQFFAHSYYSYGSRWGLLSHILILRGCFGVNLGFIQIFTMAFRRPLKEGRTSLACAAFAQAYSRGMFYSRL